MCYSHVLLQESYNSLLFLLDVNVYEQSNNHNNSYSRYTIHTYIHTYIHTLLTPLIVGPTGAAQVICITLPLVPGNTLIHTYLHTYIFDIYIHTYIHTIWSRNRNESFHSYTSVDDTSIASQQSNSKPADNSPKQQCMYLCIYYVCVYVCI